MSNPPRKLAFVLAATEQGSLIVSRLDVHQVNATKAYGVGMQVLENGSYDPHEIELATQILELRRKYFGDGVVAIDAGANIGIHSISWSRRVPTGAKIYAIEAQERLFYALAGNIALNNCFNVTAIHAAISDKDGELLIPTPDYLTTASLGSLELKKRRKTEFIGQSIDYTDEKMSPVRMMTLDSLQLKRLDFLKLDVEGMEIEVLDGAQNTIAQHKPVILAEHQKIGKTLLAEALSKHGYTTHLSGENFLAVHPTDKVSDHIEKSPTGENVLAVHPVERTRNDFENGAKSVDFRDAIYAMFKRKK